MENLSENGNAITEVPEVKQTDSLKLYLAMKSGFNDKAREVYFDDLLKEVEELRKELDELEVRYSLFDGSMLDSMLITDLITHKFRKEIIEKFNELKRYLEEIDDKIEEAEESLENNFFGFHEEFEREHNNLILSNNKESK